MLFPFLHLKNKSKSFAVFSIDSGSLTLTILEKINKKGIHISYVRKVSLESDKVTSPSDLLRLIKVNLNKIFTEVVKQKVFITLKHSTEIIVLIGSPWHVGWNDKVVIDKDKQFTVTHKLIDGAVRESFIKMHKDLSITNISVMNYKLNGYNIPDPINKITKSMDLNIYISSAPTLFIDEITNTIKYHLPHNKLSFMSLNGAVDTAIGSNSSEKDYLIIIPESKTTEIVLVRNRVIQNEASIPFGGEVLARNLFGDKSFSIQESISKAKRFIDGDLDVSDLDKVGQVLDKSKGDFLNDFRNVLWKMNDSTLIPSVVFVVGRNIASHFILDWLNKETYSSETYTIEGFKIINIRGSDLVNFGLSKNMKSKKNIPLSVAVSFKIVDNINV